MRLEKVVFLVGFQRIEIVDKTKIPDFGKLIPGKRNVFDDEPPVLKNRKLFVNGKRGFGVFHEGIKKVPPWYASWRGVAESVDTKV